MGITLDTPAGQAKPPIRAQIAFLTALRNRLSDEDWERLRAQLPREAFTPEALFSGFSAAGASSVAPELVEPLRDLVAEARAAGVGALSPLDCGAGGR